MFFLTFIHKPRKINKIIIKNVFSYYLKSGNEINGIYKYPINTSKYNTFK